MNNFGSRTGMRKLVMVSVISVMCMMLAGTSVVNAQGFGPEAASVMSMNGLIDDFTPALDANGPWQVSGLWSISLRGRSGKGDFSVALNMLRANSSPRTPHTHHVMLVDAEVVPTSNGFQISGNAIITGNGNVAGFSGSPVTVVVSGGDTVTYSNIAITFGGAAVGHFGDEPLRGIVAPR